MNKKKIKKAAKAYDIEQQKIMKELEEKIKSKSVLCTVVSKNPGAAFEDGINWFLDHLWHDVNEEPIEGEKLIVEREDKIYFYGYRQNNYYLIINAIGVAKEAIRVDSTTRWFYINDLIKHEDNFE